MAWVQVSATSIEYLQLTELHRAEKQRLSLQLAETATAPEDDLRNLIRVGDNDQRETLPTDLPTTASGRHPLTSATVPAPEEDSVSAWTLAYTSKDLAPRNGWLALDNAVESAKCLQSGAVQEWEEKPTRMDTPVLRASKTAPISIREVKPSPTAAWMPSAEPRNMPATPQAPALLLPDIRAWVSSTRY